MNRKRRRIVATHEAGHAVVGRLLGVTVDAVVMFSTAEDTEACVMMPSTVLRDDESSVRACEIDAMISLAGRLAEHFGFPEPAKKARSRVLLEAKWEGSDLNMAYGMIIKAEYCRAGRVVPLENGPPDPEMLRVAGDTLERLFGETCALVEENWPAIERVVAVLVKHDMLEQDELDALIGGKAAA